MTFSVLTWPTSNATVHNRTDYRETVQLLLGGRWLGNQPRGSENQSAARSHSRRRTGFRCPGAPGFGKSRKQAGEVAFALLHSGTDAVAGRLDRGTFVRTRIGAVSIGLCWRECGSIETASGRAGTNAGRGSRNWIASARIRVRAVGFGRRWRECGSERLALGGAGVNVGDFRLFLSTFAQINVVSG